MCAAWVMLGPEWVIVRGRKLQLPASLRGKRAGQASWCQALFRRPKALPCARCRHSWHRLHAKWPWDAMPCPARRDASTGVPSCEPDPDSWVQDLRQVSRLAAPAGQQRINVHASGLALYNMLDYVGKSGSGAHAGATVRGQRRLAGPTGAGLTTCAVKVTAIGPRLSLRGSVCVLYRHAAQCPSRPRQLAMPARAYFRLSEANNC